MARARGGPTIAEIAAEAGVSVPTVSKVLNGRSDVAEGTRSRVEDAIARHDYRRRPRRSIEHPALIELVFHRLESAWATEIVRGVETAASGARVGVVVSELGGELRPRAEWFEDVLARRPLGVILVLAELEADQRRQLTARDIPSVVVDTAGEPPDDVPSVGSTNWSGGVAATRHLLGLGHRRLAVISGPESIMCSRARVDGFAAALDRAGLALPPGFSRHGDFEVTGGYHHARELLDRPDRPTAIFAGSDLQAIGVLRAARELGLEIPRDLSVVGYDDLPVAGWIGPGLTTVRQPLREMAGAAAEIVLTLARGETPANGRIDLATELVVRGSTAPPPR